MKKDTPQMRAGISMAEATICLIQLLPPIWAYRLPPKYPLTELVAAYTKMAVLSKEPLLQIGKGQTLDSLDRLQTSCPTYSVYMSL